MVHGSAIKPVSGETAPAGTIRLCPECLAPVTGSQAGKLFCTTAHRLAFQDRQKIRGRQLVPYAMADRLTRSGTAGSEEDRKIGKTARAVCQRLIARWAAEDKAANKGRGRMSMVAYLSRYAKHYDLPL